MGKGTTDDDVGPRGKEGWVIDIKGPHDYEEDISEILLYVVIVCRGTPWWKTICCQVKITSNSSNHVRHIKRQAKFSKGIKQRTYIFLGALYTNLQSFELKVLDNFKFSFIFQMILRR